MFTGIVEEVARVESLVSSGSGKRLSIRSALDHADTSLGDSICISGVCLTVVAKNGPVLAFDLAEETLRRTILGRLSSGSGVNLERSLKPTSRNSGHFVFGHVDGSLKLVARKAEAGSECFTWGFDPKFRAYLCEKGSVSISGVSLTVGQVRNDNFDVYLIPHTLAVTTLGEMRVGDEANLELDMLARYVVNALAAQTAKCSESKLDLEFLNKHGY
jgi:riboflavin synthase